MPKIEEEDAEKRKEDTVEVLTNVHNLKAS